MGGDELAAVLLEAQVIRVHRAQRLAQENEIGDPADQVFDAGMLRIGAQGSSGPQ